MKSARAGQWSRFVHEVGFVLGSMLVVVTMGCGSTEGNSEGSDCTAGACAYNTGEAGQELVIAGNEPAQIKGTLANAQACGANPQCASGFCVDGVCCDAKCDNKCMACSAAKKGSGVDGVCGSIAYDTDPDNECVNGACDGKNICKFYNGTSCGANSRCLSEHCVDGVCCDSECMGECQACSAGKKGSGVDGACGLIVAGTDPDDECSGAECDGGGACTMPQTRVGNGAACSSAAQCSSGHCVDGVCCDAECSGSCVACTAAKKGSGSDGTCGPIAYDTDPEEECWGGACDGLGQCKYYNGVSCATTTDCLSNYCVDGFCCGNICTGTCLLCLESEKGFCL